MLLVLVILNIIHPHRTLPKKLTRGRDSIEMGTGLKEELGV